MTPSALYHFVAVVILYLDKVDICDKLQIST